MKNYRKLNNASFLNKGQEFIRKDDIIKCLACAHTLLCNSNILTVPWSPTMSSMRVFLLSHMHTGLMKSVNSTLVERVRTAMSDRKSVVL